MKDGKIDILIERLSFLLKKTEGKDLIEINSKDRSNINQTTLQLGNSKNKKALEVLLRAPSNSQYTTDALFKIEPREYVLQVIKKNILDDNLLNKYTSIRLAGKYIENDIIDISFFIEKDSYVNNNALQTLILEHSKKLEFILPLLDKEDTKIQYSAISALARTKNKKAIPTLLNILETSNNSRIISIAIHVIGKLGGVDSENDKNILKKHINSHKLVVANALAKSGDFEELIKIITEDEDQDTRYDAVSDLSYHIDDYDKSKIPTKALINELKNDYICVEIIELLGKLEVKEAFEPLIPFLNYEMKEYFDITVILNTIEALVKIDKEKSVKYLIESLSENGGYISQMAAYHLGESGSKSAIEPLNKVCKTTKDRDTKRVAAHAVKKLNLDSKGYLYKLLKDKDEYPYIHIE